jgi:glycosyltransferase involved in cell wall biosynthesis
LERLRAALKRVIDDPALAQRLADNARQTVEGKTWTARAKQILEIILT